MKSKKIILIIALVLFICIIIGLAALLQPRDTSNDMSLNATNKGSQASENNKKTSEKKEYKRVELEDGILYSETGEKVKSDFVIGTNYFETTINDMYYTPENYESKNIEIEGMYLKNEPYEFVGRYSTSNSCAYCAGGYAYLQYEFDGKVQEELKDTENWIKVIGTWEKENVNVGTEESPQYQDYYYLKAKTIQIMNERGQDTIKN